MQQHYSVLPMIARIFIALILGVGSFSLEVIAGDVACRSSLSNELLVRVEGPQQRWRVVELADLSKDDRSLWKSLKHGPCPGIARADFDRSGRPQYALLLSARSEAKSRLLHVAQSADGEFSIRILYEGSRGNVPVIYAGKPGKYSAAEDRELTIAIKSPPIILAVLESGATAYYFAGKDIHQLVISE